MISGIYLITNKINGHMYVGGSIDIQRRFHEHKRGADADVQAIDRAILKYGKENFIYQIITELPPDWKVIGKHEKYWIKFYNTFKDRKHYNLGEGGGGTSGFKHSDESKQKMSEFHKGKTHSEESKRKMSDAKKGKYDGDNNPRWKDYARIIKKGFNRYNKQEYGIKFNGKVIKYSVTIDKLVNWFNSNYPDEELVIDESIKPQ